MESNGKLRKGIMKAKLTMSFYIAAKPPPMPYSNSTSKPKLYNNYKDVANQVGDKIIPDQPKQNIAPSTASTVGYIVNQDQVHTQPKQVSFVVPPNNGTRDSFRKKFDHPIDVRAASYISCVQERFAVELGACRNAICWSCYHLQERPTISDFDLSESWSSSSDSEKNSSCRGKDPITSSNSSYDSETNAPDDSTDTTHGEASEDNSSDSGSGYGSSGSDATSESTPEDGTSGCKIRTPQQLLNPPKGLFSFLGPE
ncbi:hypothetical protein POM88_043840 [Heracleum sosnowskyi]|uniref:Uncharacterized protein n=1 Tax=Heracleum sosnowskyi TaxID=360622 RepID=A0AAD8H4C4_9APIA|nr:hypothetical protein POM88_043840 [Heracleum sosnowskyi]